MRKLIILFMIINIIMLNAVYAEEIVAEEVYSTGAIRLTEEEREKFLEVTPEIVDVKFNDIATERIYGENTVSLASEYQSSKLIICDRDSVEEEVEVANSVQLPSYVDNSAEKYFPKIGNQGKSNSCTAWSVAYYQMTNNIAVVRGNNTKSGTDVNKYRVSPKWMYNLINNGSNDGSSVVDAMNVASCYGGASWTYCNGETTAYNYSTWNPGAEIWENALKNKIARGTYLNISDDKGIELLKKLLVDGFVVSFSTDSPKTGGLDNWHIKRGIANSTTQSICYYVEKDTGGHAMTIVGYDDAWADVNGDGVKDAGETGAFKIANSWGTTWGNDGYIWLLYDALNQTTSIPGVTNENDRTNAFWCDEVYFLEPMELYTPLIVAEVSLNTARRDQLGVEIGISDTTKTYPQNIMSITEYTSADLNGNNEYVNDNAIAFNFPSGSMNFTGGSSSSDASFTFDITPILSKYVSSDSNMWIGGTNARFYIKISDYQSDQYETKLTGFKIIDRTNNLQSSAITGLPITANGNSKIAYSDIKIVPNVVNKNKIINANFNYPIRENSVNNLNFYVRNSNNENISINLSQSSDKKTVSILPDSSYNRGNFYSLYINSGILSAGGNQLTESKEIEFYIP